MSAGAPLATLRLTRELLDAKEVSRVLLHDNGGLIRSATQGLKIKSRSGVWLASTDDIASPRAADHLRVLIDLFASRLFEIKVASPDIVIDFSLLVFDPAFDLKDLSRNLLSSVTEIGDLDVEMSAIGKGVTFTAHDFRQYAV